MLNKRINIFGKFTPLFLFLSIMGQSYFYEDPNAFAVEQLGSNTPQATIVYPGWSDQGFNLVRDASILNPNAQAIIVVTKDSVNVYKNQWQEGSKPDYSFKSQEGAESILSNLKEQGITNVIINIDMNIGPGNFPLQGAKEIGWATSEGTAWVDAYKSISGGIVGSLSHSFGNAPAGNVIRNSGAIDYAIMNSPQAMRDSLNELAESIPYQRLFVATAEGDIGPVTWDGLTKFQWIKLEKPDDPHSGMVNWDNLHNKDIDYTTNISGKEKIPIGELWKGLVGRAFAGDPTFVQPPKIQSPKGYTSTGEKSIKDNLTAKLSVPSKDSLIRGNVPVFGLAYGKDFKEYRVEYGEGKEPKGWIIIKQSTVPQTKDVTPADLDDSADITIHGNLATWDTGLKSYVYLPDYPPDHPVDLNGIYTLKLVVEGKDGEKVEDRVTVEVGEAIPNAWGGIVKSKDKKVTLTIPEQSLMDSFRVISIKPTGEGLSVPLDKNRKLISNVYEFRETEERFTKDAILEMEYSKEALKELNPNKLGIYGYNPEKKKWIYLKSTRNEKKKKVTTAVRELSPYYAIFASAQKGEGSVVEGFASTATSSEQLKTTRAAGDNNMYLVRDTFEDGMGEWSNRDGDAGAMVSRDNTATPDSTYCLKLTNTNYGGNFASNVRRTPFDVREHPIVQFDYKIPLDVKINFLVKVNSRWYEIGFTGAPKELRNTRVNIANIGRIENVIADGKWHTTRFNLYEMLRTKTGNHIVKEMIMADWDVGGYMKLKFGTNRQGATYYIDNFTISKESSSGPRIDGEVLLIDNFDQKKEVNSLGGISNVFTDSAGGKAQLSYVGNDNNSKRGSYALQISYDVSQKGSFAGYMTQLRNLDIREYKTLSFAIKGSKSGETFKVGLKDRSGNESKILVNDYVPQGIGTTWQKVAIPLVAFSKIKDWGAMENLSLAFENSLGSGEGAVLLDDIQFEKDLKSFMVNNFEKDGDSNLLGGKSWTFSNGAAGINGGYEKDSSNKIYCLSYGGEIGDLFTYAGWTTQLQGIDVSQCKSVSLLVKGAAGGEEPNIYLDDGNFRWGVYINRYKPMTTSWQKVTIPLKDFADYGVDLTHLEELQVVFEWERMSGAIYIDDIRFDYSGDKVKEK